MKDGRERRVLMKRDTDSRNRFPAIPFAVTCAVLVTAAGVAMLAERQRPGCIFPDVRETSPEWLVRSEVRTSLDLAGLRLSSPQGGRVQVAGPGPLVSDDIDLYAFRGTSCERIDSAQDLATRIHAVRGEGDGLEFWRLVDTYALEIRLPQPGRPPRAVQALSLVENREAPSSPGSPFWWENYDRGIGGGRPRRGAVLAEREDSEAMIVRAVDPARWRWERPPELLEARPGAVVQFVQLEDGKGGYLILEATLRAGRLSVRELKCAPR